MEPNLKPTFERSVDAVTLANRFSKMSIGDVCTYSEMGKLIRPMDIQHKNRSILYSACKIARDEFGIVLGCISGVGMKRLSDSEISDIPMFTMGQIRRKARESAKATKCADFTKLSDDDKRKLWFGQSMLGAISLATSSKKLAALRQHHVVTQQFTCMDALKALVN